MIEFVSLRCEWSVYDAFMLFADHSSGRSGPLLRVMPAYGWGWLTTSTAAPSPFPNPTSPLPLRPRPPLLFSRLSRGQLSSLSSSSSSSWASWSFAVSGSFWTRIAACRPPPGQTTWRRTPSITGFPDRQPERQQP